MNESLANPIPDLELVEIIKGNLLPEFIVHIGSRDYDTIERFEAMCRRVEANLDLSKPGRSVAPVEPELEVDATENRGCYHCGDVQHFKRECPKLGNHPKRENDSHSEIAELKKMVAELTKQVQALAAQNVPKNE